MQRNTIEWHVNQAIAAAESFGESNFQDKKSSTKHMKNESFHKRAAHVLTGQMAGAIDHALCILHRDGIRPLLGEAFTQDDLDLLTDAYRKGVGIEWVDPVCTE